MARVPFQILVFPYIKKTDSNKFLFALFRRSKEGTGKELLEEVKKRKRLEAAKRES